MRNAGPILIASLLAWAPCAGAAGDAPTEFVLPEGALDVARESAFEGAAFQTSFTLHAEFPANPALDHYSKIIGAPWISCQWGESGWGRYIDVSRKPPLAVHQWLHMWVDESSRRTLALAVRYLSSAASPAEQPDSDEQQIVLVERTDQDIADAISTLQLDCGAGASGPVPGAPAQ